MKWVGLIVLLIVIYVAVTGNMGGAQSATNNYVSVRGG
jgi:hypothetical protein